MTLLDTPEGATPLTQDDLNGLLPYLTTREELDSFEQLNITEAVQWAFRSRTLKKDLLEPHNLQLLHQKMFKNTWKWAGTFRKTQTNIGVESPLIAVELKKLCHDVKWWLEHTTYPLVEIAVRLHHRLVWVHPFPNGNGRHARLSADLLLHFHGGQKLTWGGKHLIRESDLRREYLASLREADNRSYERLIRFAQS